MEINGIQYIEKPIEKSKSTNSVYDYSGYFGAMLAMFGGFPVSSKVKHKSLPTDNVIKEFELIQQKKSNLSRSEREQVVREFNKHFMRVEP